MAIRPKAPLDPIQAQEMNNDLFGLASGENDELGNSLAFYRQFIGNFFVGGIVTKLNGLNFNIAPIQAVINGNFFDIASQDGVATADGYTVVDVSATGIINITSNQRADGVPALENDSERLAVIDSDQNGIIAIQQSGLDVHGNVVRRTGAIDGQNISDKTTPVSKLKDFVVARDVRMSCARGWNKETITLPKGQKMSSNRYAVLATMNGEYVNGGQGSARFQLGIAYSISQTQVVVYVYNSYTKTLSCGVNLICAVET